MIKLAATILYLFCLYNDAITSKPWMFAIDFFLFPVAIVRGVLYACGVI